VENFGKISDRTFDFAEGLNIICEENGWGKSTLAAFIRVMLYGFENERKRDDLENERKRYRPWQGGVYGGQLELRAGEKTYLVTRTFGNKADEDTFELRDAKTNVVSEHYSQHIGEELFGIDRSSFDRTVFISQNDCTTAVTDGINAKIGNLTECLSDISDYEKVMDRLTDLLNSMTPSRKTGALSKMKSRISELDTSVRGTDAVDAAMKVLVGKRAAKKEEYKALKDEQEELQKKQEQLGTYKDLQAKKELYETLCRGYEERKQKAEQAKAYFSGKLPSDELEDYMEDSTKLSTAGQIMSVYRLDEAQQERFLELSEVFREGVPEREELEEQKQRIDQLQELQLQYLQQTRLQKVQTQNAKPRIVSLLFIAGIIFIILGIWVGFIGFAAGIICIITGLVLKRTKKRPVEEKTEETDYEGRMESCLTELRSFLAGYYPVQDLGPDEAAKKLYQLEKDVQDYKGLYERTEKYKEALKICNEQTSKIKAYFSQLGMTVENDISRQLFDIQAHLQEYRHCERELKDAAAAKEKFECSEDFERIQNMKVMETEISMEALATSMNKNTEQLELVHQDILSYNRQIEQYQEKSDELGEEKHELEHLREVYGQDTKKYERLKKTKELLEQAKTSFTARYSQPLQESFEAYYQMIAGKDGTAYHLDANTNLTVEEMGRQHETRFLSTSYQDLTGICMRMALVDAMFSDEKPFVVFDDPFADFDQQKITGGLEFLKQISTKYQVVYFTCHESRS
jgi:DNA repair exonuclease SbcCD ATPase subunit